MNLSVSARNEIFRRSLFVVAVVISFGIFLVSLFCTISKNSSIPSNPPIHPWAARFLGIGDSLATVGGTGNPYEMPRRGELVLWDLVTGQKEYDLRQNSSLRALASSPDGRCIATGDFTGRIKLIRRQTGKTIACLQSKGPVNAVAFAPDNSVIVGGGLDGSIIIWSIATKKARTFTLSNEVVLNVAIAGDCSTVVATTRSGKAYVLNLHQPEKRKEIRVYDGPFIDEPNAEGLAFTPNGSVFATACQNRVRFWRSPDGKRIGGFNAPKSINSIAFSPDGRIVAAVDTDGVLSFWDSITYQCRIAKHAHIGSSFCVAFSPDGERIATVGRDDLSIKIWSTATFVPVSILACTNGIASSKVN